MIRIVIVDDHQLLREGLKKLIETRKEMVVIGSYTCAAALFNEFDPQTTDILILDLSLPGLDGMEVLKRIKTECAHIKVLILSMYPEENFAVRALKNGASGYINKGTDSREIIAAIKTIYHGGIHISEKIVNRLAKSLQGSETVMPHELLSDREFQVLQLIGKGVSTAEIGEQLYISENTVRTYRSRILKKMNMSSTADLIKYVVINKLS